VHMVAVSLSLGFSAVAVTFPPHQIHGPFAIICLASAVYNGSKRYEWLLVASDARVVRRQFMCVKSKFDVNINSALFKG
jgi:hypothetical protein